MEDHQVDPKVELEQVRVLKEEEEEEVVLVVDQEQVVKAEQEEDNQEVVELQDAQLLKQVRVGQEDLGVNVILELK